MVRVGRATMDVGETWAPVLLAAGLWVFAWAYAQLPPPGRAVAAFQMGSPPASSAGLGADNSGRESASEIAKPVEDPIGDANTLHIRKSTNLAGGSRSGTRDIPSAKPVIPLHLTEDWKLVARTALPLVWSSSTGPERSVPSGLVAATVSMFLASHKPIDRWMLGAGPIVQVPAISSKTPGLDVWGVGPAFVVGKLAAPIDAGAYVNNVSSLGGTSGHGAAGRATGGATGDAPFTVNPVAHDSVGNGWFVRSAPSIAADDLPDGARWTLPVGAQVGRMIKIDGELPIDLLVGVYYDALQGEFGARWQLRTGVGFIF